MQKLLVLFTIVACPLFASNPANPMHSIFQDDLTKVDREMSGLTALEQFVQEEKMTQSQLMATCNPLAENLSDAGDLSTALFGSVAPNHEQLLNIPGFLWGFCCSVVGMFLVYIAIDDPAAKKKEGAQAIYGCALGTALWVGLYIWLVFTVSYY